MANTHLLKDSSTGHFLPKGDDVRHVRSVRLTDDCWENLGQIAASKNMTRADFLESLNEAGNFEAVDQEIDADTIANLLQAFVDDVYDPDGNEYEVPSRDKAVVKRLIPIIIQYLSDNL